MIHTLTLTDDPRIEQIYIKSLKLRPLDMIIAGASSVLGIFDFILVPLYLATRPDPMDINHKAEIEANLDKILQELKINIKYDRGQKLYIHNLQALELKSYEIKQHKIIINFRFVYSHKDFPGAKIFKQEECCE